MFIKFHSRGGRSHFAMPGVCNPAQLTRRERLYADAEVQEITMSTAEVSLPTTHVAPQIKSKTMKALVYHGPGKNAWEEKPMPAIQKPGDAIIRITTSTICGTDLHILKG